MILLHFKVLPGQIVQVRQAVGTDRSMYNLDQMQGRAQTGECTTWTKCQVEGQSAVRAVRQHHPVN